MRPLVVFISSTADLRTERDAVEDALRQLDVHGSRFEAWPSAPDDAITECLRRVEESDAMVLLLGSRYGTVDSQGISVTRLEYRHARQLSKRIFAFVLASGEREPEQRDFIAEVERDLFRCPLIEGTADLATQVRRSFVEAFTRSFREASVCPTEQPPASERVGEEKATVVLPDDAEQAHDLLKQLYKDENDDAISQLAARCEEAFAGDARILNLVYMAEVNVGINGGPAEHDRVARAITFWDSADAKARWAEQALLYNRANALCVLGRHSAAIELYNQSLALNPQEACCWKNLGSAHLKLGNSVEARRCFERALGIDPLHFEALYCIGTRIMKDAGDLQVARSYFERIQTTGLTPGQLASVFGWKGVIYLRESRYPEGIASIEDALAFDPDAAWAWACAGRLYALVRHEGDEWLPAAVVFWLRFVDKFPYNAEGWAELGYVYLAIGRKAGEGDWPESALGPFQKAVNLGYEDDGLVWDRIGHIHQEQGDWREAEQAYRKAAAKDPRQFGYCLGLSLIHQARYEEALPWVMAAAQQHQPDALSWFQVGLCFDKLGRSKEAVAAYEKAIGLDPDYPEPRFNLGGLYFNRDEKARAIAVWREAIKRFPDYELWGHVRAILGPDAAKLDAPGAEDNAG